MDYFKLLDLGKEPFSNSPDPGFFFRSKQHAQCLHALEIAIRLKRGLNVVAGGIGTGKTTLCRQLIQTLGDDPSISAHLLLEPSFHSSGEMLGALVGLFSGEDVDAGMSEWKMKEKIKSFLLREGLEKNRTVVLIVDEGQTMTPQGIEILRELLNFETNEHKLLQIVIFAQEEIRSLFAQVPNFADRINVFHTLGPLDFRDTKAMIEFRLDESKAGLKRPKLFPFVSLVAVYLATGGYPRKMIHLCHRVLLAMIMQNRSRASWRIVWACAGSEISFKRKVLRRMPAAGAALAFLVFALLFIGLEDTAIQPIDTDVTAHASLSEVHSPSRQADSNASAGSSAMPRAAAVLQEGDAVSLHADMPGTTAASRQTDHPAILGRVVLLENEFISTLIKSVCGRFSPTFLPELKRANPTIQDLDRVEAGTEIAMPAIPVKTSPDVFETYFIQVRKTASLQDGIDQLRQLGREVRLVASWNSIDGLEFVLVDRQGFASREMAEEYLSAAYGSQGLVSLRRWSPETVFFTSLTPSVNQALKGVVYE
ncbi:MAG: ExeA family protein [Desulfovibrionales bacterium]